MNLNEPLKAIGLNNSEIKVYLFVLEQGASTPPAVARGTGITRTNCYAILENLDHLGLVSRQEQDKKYLFVARNPASLIQNMDKKREAVGEILPDLQTLYRSQSNKPKIQFFEGWTEVKEIFLESLKAKKITAFGSALQLEKIDKKFFDNYQKEVGRNKIIFYDLLTNNSISTLPIITKEIGKLYEVKLLQKKYDYIPTNLLLWDQNIALIALTEPVFGTILNNEPLAKTFGAIFEMIWENIGR